jgi:PAS domain S-box-containing protein
MQFTTVNDAFCELSGFSREELLAMNPMDLMDEHSQRIFQRRIVQWMAGEKPDESVEYRVWPKDGHEIYATLNVTFTRDENGRPLGATVIGHDVTERRRAEELLKQRNTAIQEYSHKLEQSNKELENFAFIASHDLQEPLRKIEGFGKLLAEKANPGLSENERLYVQRMQSAAERMREMIDDLLALSRVSSAGNPFVAVDLNRVIKAVIDDLEFRVKQTHGHISMDDLPTIMADPIQMQQLFQNLIGNALKFSRHDETPVVKIYSRASSAGRVEICVEDNGIGFDTAQADRLFQPFQRLHGRSEYEGTGIGLSICRKITERHGGSIRAWSEPGKGSTFLVDLPA